MVTKQELLEKIGVLLNELSEQYELLMNSRQEPDGLEVELFEANASYFTSHISILNKIIRQEKTGEDKGTATVEATENSVGKLPDVSGPEVTETSFTPATAEQEKAPEKAVPQQPEKEEEPMQAAVAETEEEEEVEAPAKEEPTLKEPELKEKETENEPEEEPAPAVSPQVVVQEVQIEKKQVTLPDEDDVPQRPLTLNERLSAQRTSYPPAASAGSQLTQHTPQRITDLKSAISLNDKLLFIRDLFNGYSLAYSEAIELLNRYDTFTEANTFLQANYAQKNSWDTKQATVEKLYVILRKKYV